MDTKFNLRSIQSITPLFLLCCVLGYISMSLIPHYELVQGLASWYFPHGVRLILLFVLPFRLWLVACLGTQIGNNLFEVLFFDRELTVEYILDIGGFYLIESTTGLIVLLLANRFVKGNWLRLSNVMWVILLTVIYRLIYMSVAAGLDLTFFAEVPSDAFVEIFIIQQLSGYLVGFYFFTLHLLWIWFNEKGNVFSRADTKAFTTYTLLLLAVFAAAYLFNNELAYLLKITMFIPLVLAATRFGWQGIMLFSFVINTILFMFLFDQPPEVLLEYQPYMLSYMLVAFLVSGVMYENELNNAAVVEANSSLAEKNKRLQAMTKQLQSLSRSVINIQEKERQFLSQELHDEIGQNIIALKTAIRLLEVNGDDAMKSQYETLKQRTDTIYGSVYNLMHWLRPVVLDDFGLYKILSGNYFSERLMQADIDYQLIKIEKRDLPELIETALFRITQEAVTNTIKHSNASTFSLSLFPRDNDICLVVSDDGDDEYLNQDTSSGQFGLEGIQSRVVSLNGECLITRDDGFRIEVSIPLAPDKD